MKNSKIILIVQAVVMYLIHIPFYICLILARVTDLNLNVLGALIVAGLCANLIMLPVCLVAIVFAVLNLTADYANPAKTTFIVKLVLIPWFVLNCVICFLLVAGFLNPWLMLAVSLLIGIEVFVTFVYTACSSLQTVAYTARQIIKKRLPVTPTVIVGLIFSFIFVLDIVGSYLLYSELKRFNL